MRGPRIGRLARLRAGPDMPAPRRRAARLAASGCRLLAAVKKMQVDKDNLSALLGEVRTMKLCRNQ